MESTKEVTGLKGYRVSFLDRFKKQKKKKESNKGTVTQRLSLNVWVPKVSNRNKGLLEKGQFTESVKPVVNAQPSENEDQLC